MADKIAPEYKSRTDELVSPPGQGAILSENRAREALPIGRTRYVLAISMALVIIGFVALYFILVK
jgi:hypothetical protein